jgi:hypothetical protein
MAGEPQPAAHVAQLRGRRVAQRLGVVEPVQLEQREREHGPGREDDGGLRSRAERGRGVHQGGIELARPQRDGREPGLGAHQPGHRPEAPRVDQRALEVRAGRRQPIRPRERGTGREVGGRFRVERVAGQRTAGQRDGAVDAAGGARGLGRPAGQQRA